MCRAALFVAGCIFSLLALVHLIRLINPFQIVIGNFVVPEYFSLFGFALATVMSIWMFWSVKCHRN